MDTEMDVDTNHTPAEATARPTLMHQIGATIYNVTRWTGHCLANGFSYSQPYIRTAATSSRRCITQNVVDTYRVAVQVVNGAKRRAVETRVPRPAPTPQQEQREIIRASHRPLRSSRHRPSPGRPYTTITRTAGSSPRTPTHTIGSWPRTPIHTIGSWPRTPMHTTGSSPSTPIHTTGSSSSSPTHATEADPDTVMADSPDYDMEYDLDETMKWHPIVHELEKRLIAKWGLERAEIIFLKWVYNYELTDEEADFRTPEEVAQDVAAYYAAEAAAAVQAGETVETGQVESSPLSSAPSSIERYRPADLDECEVTPFRSPLHFTPSSDQNYRPARLDESEPFSSSLSSAPASIEKYRPAGLDQCEVTPSNSSLHSAPSRVQNYRPASLDESGSFSSSLSSAPASIEKYRPADLDKCEATPFNTPLHSTPSSVRTDRPARLDESEPFSSPLSSAPASIEKYTPATVEKHKFKTPKTPKTVAFHHSPTTGAPVTHVKRYIIGEAMDYVDVPSPLSGFTPGTVARTEAETSDSPIERHVAHMELSGDAAVLQPIHNGAIPVANRKNKARDCRKRLLEEGKLAKAAKEAEKKAKEEDARKKRNERRMPAERVIQPLSAEWERRVDAALAAKDGTLAVTSAGGALSRRDLGTVLPVSGKDRAGGWLNDEVVTGYLQAVVDHGQSTTASAGRGKTPKFFAFNTFFYSTIAKKGVEGVRRWAEKAKIGGRTLLEVERVFVPVHESLHWTLVVVSPMARTIEYFDSLGGAGTRHVGHVKAWLAQELGPAWVEREWTVVDSPSPRQANGLDCGVFAVTTAKMITLGINPLAYGPEDIPVQRRRMVAELLNGGFVGDFEP